jgi:enoyl-CoA hydratase
MTSEHIHYEVADGIARVIIDRTDKRNAMSLDMWLSIPKLVAAAEADAAVKTIILQGADASAFAAGADIEEMLGFASSERAAWQLMDTVVSAERALAECSKPIIAMIRGVCVGGGIELALGCDLRFAADNARFAVPPAKLGLVYSLTSTRRLIELVGLGTARDLLYSGRTFDSAEARSMGLIEREFANDQIEAETLLYAQTLGRRSQYSVQAAKRMSNAIRGGATEEDAALRKLRVGAFFGPDLAEGVEAFFEKRPPRFTWA